MAYSRSPAPILVYIILFIVSMAWGLFGSFWLWRFTVFNIAAGSSGAEAHKMNIALVYIIAIFFGLACPTILAMWSIKKLRR